MQKLFLKVHLKKQLYTFKMDWDSDAKNQFNQFRGCVSKLLQVDVKIQGDNRDALMSSLLKRKTILTMISFTYRYCFAMNSNSRASYNTRRSRTKKIYLSRDENLFESSQRCDVKCFYCHNNRHIKRYCKKILNSIKDLGEKKK